MGLLSVLLLLPSCNNSWEQELKRLIGQEVVFPTEMAGFYSGVLGKWDMRQLLDDNHGIVLKVYSEVECKTCIVEKIPDLALRIKSTMEDIPIVILFPMSIGKEIETISKLSPGIYCLIDQDKEFMSKNRFLPKKEVLRTWLVDSSSHIRVCGDPSGNEKILDLYKQVLEE